MRTTRSYVAALMPAREGGEPSARAAAWRAMSIGSGGIAPTHASSGGDERRRTTEETSTTPTSARLTRTATPRSTTRKPVGTCRGYPARPSGARLDDLRAVGGRAQHVKSRRLPPPPGVNRVASLHHPGVPSRPYPTPPTP